MAEIKGLFCNHLEEFHPVEGMIIEPVIEVDTNGEKLNAGMTGKCLASKSIGGNCDHSCREIVVKSRNWIFNDFDPVKPRLGGKECAEEYV